MWKREMVWTAALLALLSGGCGTVFNFAGALSDPDNYPTMYGGVMNDLTFPDLMAASAPSEANPQSRESVKGQLFLLGLGILDFPLSFVADTLTLPITAYYDQRRSPKDKRERVSGNDSPAAEILREEYRPKSK